MRQGGRQGVQTAVLRQCGAQPCSTATTAIDTRAVRFICLSRPGSCRSLKTVVVTLWGGTAEGPGRELEEQAGVAPVVAISSCRVSSYNGVSGMPVPGCNTCTHQPVMHTVG